MVRMPHSSCRGPGFDPWVRELNPTSATKIWYNRKKKKKIFGVSLVVQWQRICRPDSAEDMGLIPDPGRPCATEQLSPWATTTESCRS